MRKALLAALAALLLTPAAADARRDPVVEATRLAGVAAQWWQAKGFTACAPAHVARAAALPPGKWAWAFPSTCEVDVGPEPLRMLASTAKDYAAGLRRETACTLIFHEVGHLAGLAHTPGGLMAEDASIYGYPPGPCVDYGAKGLTRSERLNYRWMVSHNRPSAARPA